MEINIQTHEYLITDYEKIYQGSGARRNQQGLRSKEKSARTERKREAPQQAT